MDTAVTPTRGLQPPRSPLRDVSNMKGNVTPGLTAHKSPLPFLSPMPQSRTPGPDAPPPSYDEVMNWGEYTASKAQYPYATPTSAMQYTPVAAPNSTKRRVEAAECRASQLRREKAELEVRVSDLEAQLQSLQAQATTAQLQREEDALTAVDAQCALEDLKIRTESAEQTALNVQGELDRVRAEAYALSHVNACLAREKEQAKDALQRSLEELEAVRGSLQLLSCRPGLGLVHPDVTPSDTDYRSLYLDAVQGRSSLEVLVRSLGSVLGGLEERERELQGAEGQLEQAMSLVAQSHARYVQSLGEVEAHKQQAHSAVQEQARLRDELAALKSRVEAATSTQLQVDQLEVQLLQQKQENATLRCKLAASEELLQQVTAVKGGNAAAINASFNCSTHALMEALEHQRVAMEALGSELATERDKTSQLRADRERLLQSLHTERSLCDEANAALKMAEKAIELLRDELESARVYSHTHVDHKTQTDALVQALRHENDKLVRQVDVLSGRVQRSECAVEAQRRETEDTVKYMEEELAACRATESELRQQLSQASGRMFELSSRLSTAEAQSTEGAERSREAERAACDLQNECDRLRAKLGDQERMLKEEMSYRFRAEEESVALRTQLATVSARMDEAVRRGDTLDKLLEQERSHLSALRLYVDSLSVAESAASPLIAEVKALEQRCRMLEGKCQDKDGVIAALQDAVSALFMDVEASRTSMASQEPREAVRKLAQCVERHAEAISRLLE